MSTEDQPDYVSALHLHSLPFEPHPDSNLFFADPALTRRLDQVQHLAQFGGLILVIEGEPGSGKTAFLKELVNRAGNGWKICRIQGDVNFAVLEIIRQIARQFDLDDEGHPDDLGRKILDFCQVLTQASQVPVIMVDDADRVPPAVLGQLLMLGGTPQETLRQLRIILFGTPGLREELVKAGVCKDSSLIHSVIMHPLDEAQTDAYLMYRLSMAGFSGPSPFSGTEVRGIQKSGSGLPSRINRLAHQTLMEHVWAVPRQAQGQRQDTGTRFSSRLIPDKLSGEGKWLAAGVGAVLIAGLLWLVAPEPGSDDIEVVGGMVSEQLMLPGSERHGPEVAPEHGRQTPVEPRQPQAEAPLSEFIVANEASSEEAPAPLLLPVPVMPEAPATAAEGEDAASSPGPEGGVAAAMVEADEAENSPEPLAQADEPAPAPVPVAPAPRMEPQIPPSAPPPPRQVASLEESAVVVPAASAPSGVHREAWLMQQSPTAVTLQVLGVSKEASLQRFLKAHQLPEPAAYFHTVRNGKPWYVLVQGVYPDRAAAKAAVASLPEALRRGNPWPRSFQSIQTDIQPEGSP